MHPNPPVYKMIPFLQEALNKNPIAKHNWEKLTPSRQKEILRYLYWLKSNEAKKRNLAKIMQVLTSKEVRFMARDWKVGK